MQDIDDFDPLDDILLSDDEPPKAKPAVTKSSIVSDNADIVDIDNESRRNKKKKMFAELFGSNDDVKVELKQTLEPSTSSKSDWLDLKNDSPERNVPTDSIFSGKGRSPDEERRADSRPFSAAVTDRNPIKVDSGVTEKSVHFVDNNNGAAGRRKSESNSAAEIRKRQPRFKSLDLNLDFDFDVAPTIESVTKTVNSSNDTSAAPDDFLGELSYTPSVGVNRRPGTGRTRSSFVENKLSSSYVIEPENPQKFSLDTNRDTLPSWLEAKTEIKSTELETKSKEIGSFSQRASSDGKDLTTIDGQTKGVTTADHRENNQQSNFVSAVSELVKKQENLKQMAKTQVQQLSSQEQEIQNSALELMKLQRNSVKALMQILAVDDVLHESNLESSNTSRGCLENTLLQLQTKLMQQELEKTEVEMQLKHVERKNKIDLSMMEDLYKYKLQIAEEKEIHFKSEIVFMQEEFNAKLLKQKEAEEELVRAYNEKIRALQDEHLSEMKRAVELHNLKSAVGLTVSEKKNTEESVSKELVLKEIAIENKQKELLEFEERLNREKIALDSKKVNLDVRIEEFETKMAKEKLNIEQQKRDLKLTQDIFAEKEANWEREKQREKSYLSACKEELEILKENLLIDERKLMKEKFEITAGKARLEAVMTAEGGSNQIGDVIQARAELQGTIDEVRRLKSKLESERNEIKNEEMRQKEESWRLRNIEQELSLQQKHFQKLLDEADSKRDEGMRALRKAQLIESQMNERVENVEKRMMELNRREELLTKEKIELSKERDLLNKKKYQLDMILPQLSYEEQLPYDVLNKTLMDPRLMIMKLKAENDLGSLL